MKLLAFAIAAALWILVSGEEESVRTYSVPLDFAALARDRILSGETPGTVQVRVRGSDAVLRSLAADDLRIPLDVSRLQPGKRKMEAIAPGSVQGIPSGAAVDSITPDSVPLLVERRISRTLKLLPRLEGSPVEGIAVKRVEMDPDRVVFEGPESEVASLSTTATEPILLDGRSETFTAMVGVPLPSTRIRLAETRPVKVTVHLEKRRIDETTVRHRRHPGRRGRVPSRSSDDRRGRCRARPAPRRATARLSGNGRGPVRILVGRDTRESGPWIQESLIAGVRRAGGDADPLGVVTTPGLAYLTGRGGYDAGAMISASHNPFADNGIKIFAPDQLKLSDDIERALEEDILREVAEVSARGVRSSYVAPELRATARAKPPKGHLPPPSAEETEISGRLLDLYRRFLVESLSPGTSLSGLRLAIDCAHGAAARHRTVAVRLARAPRSSRVTPSRTGATSTRSAARSTPKGSPRWSASRDPISGSPSTETRTAACSWTGRGRAPRRRLHPLPRGAAPGAPERAPRRRDRRHGHEQPLAREEARRSGREAAAHARSATSTSSSGCSPKGSPSEASSRAT